MRTGKPRIRIKRSVIPGTEPVFISSNELSSYSASTQITTGELYLNAADGMLWVGLTGSTSLIGASSAFTSSLSDYLPLAGSETITGPIDYEPYGAMPDFNILVASGGTLTPTSFLDLQIGSGSGVFGNSTNANVSSTNVGVFFGSNNHISGSSNNSAIIGGINNVVNGATYAALIGGSGNTVTGNNSVVIGGAAITGSDADTVYVPNLNSNGTAWLNAASASTLSAWTFFAHTISGMSPVQINGTFIENSSITATTFYSGGTDLSDLIGGAGAVTTYTNGTNNRVVTSTGAGGINGESNLTFDGSTLTVTGAFNATTTVSSGGTDLSTLFAPYGTVGELSMAGVQSSNFTAVAGNRHPVATNLGAVVVTPPTSPVAGQRFGLCDVRRTWDTNNCTINFTTAGQRFNGATSGADLALSVQDQTVTFEYVSATYGWTVIGGHLS